LPVLIDCQKTQILPSFARISEGISSAALSHVNLISRDQSTACPMGIIAATTKRRIRVVALGILVVILRVSFLPSAIIYSKKEKGR
jgi:hypothetical protein